MRPHRRQPNRLPRPWDSPGKNTGVGCHFLLQCMKVKSESESEVAQSCPTLSDPMDCSLPGSSILQYSGLQNSMDCIVHGVAESDTTEQLPLYFTSKPPPSHSSWGWGIERNNHARGGTHLPMMFWGRDLRPSIVGPPGWGAEWKESLSSSPRNSSPLPGSMHRIKVHSRTQGILARWALLQPNSTQEALRLRRKVTYLPEVGGKGARPHHWCLQGPPFP